MQLQVHGLVEEYAGDTRFDAPQNVLEAQPHNAPQRKGGGAQALAAPQPMVLTWDPGGQGCAARHLKLTPARRLALKPPHLQPFPDLWTLTQRLLQEAETAGLLPDTDAD